MEPVERPERNALESRAGREPPSSGWKATPVLSLTFCPWPRRTGPVPAGSRRSQTSVAACLAEPQASRVPPGSKRGAEYAWGGSARVARREEGSTARRPHADVAGAVLGGEAAAVGGGRDESDASIVPAQQALRAGGPGECEGTHEEGFPGHPDQEAQGGVRVSRPQRDRPNDVRPAPVERPRAQLAPRAGGGPRSDREDLVLAGDEHLLVAALERGQEPQPSRSPRDAAPASTRNCARNCASTGRARPRPAPRRSAAAGWIPPRGTGTRRRPPRRRGREWASTRPRT